MEACRVVILQRADGAVDVAAPMKHKELCYDILADARTVIERTGEECFSVLSKRVVCVMQMSGLVDVGAPLPSRELCYHMLAQARDVIERYDDEAAPPMRPFSREILGD